ncbi:MAG: hypothetical protein IJL26_04575 [Clostridia bacterium]|nr:hypothetical protein [Clostridia bacterium]
MDVGSFARELCLCAAGCAILARLLPRGNLKKYGEALLGVFLLTVVFLPIGRAVRRSAVLTAQTLPAAQVERPAESAVNDAVRAQTEREIRAALTDAGIAFASVTVDSHIDGDGVINIDRVQIETDDAQGAKALLRERFGIGEDLCETIESSPF